GHWFEYIEGQQASGLEKQPPRAILGPILASFGALELFQRPNPRIIPSSVSPEQNFPTDSSQSNEIGGLTFYESIIIRNENVREYEKTPEIEPRG
ncbi:MAG: hypothetical protein PHI97_33460, partial [Desulfobulbus sp.]|nr:hypothetical protein [Desulfobulbus sp.]